VLTIKIQGLSAGLVVALTLTGVILTATTVGLLSVSQEVPFEGTINTLNVGVFLDESCTQNCTSMSWGGVFAGDVETKKIYVKNTGNTDLELSMTVTDWEPDNADGPVSMTWNKENYVLNPNEVIEATLTLTISEDAVGISNFGYKMLIIGTG
jgi:hypothetical protein